MQNELTKKQIKQLQSRKFRLNNMYKIQDKNSQEITLQFNAAQQTIFYDNRHNRKIILKSRQRGISTAYVASNIDKCIHIPGTQAGIQSIGKHEAAKLTSKANLMWDRYPDELKQMLNLKVTKNNTQTGMEFSNGSVLRIGNFRGDTLQSLHISELGKIARMYPEKARELKTGAFQAVAINNDITIESTAEGDVGLFAEMWREAYRLYLLGYKSPKDICPTCKTTYSKCECEDRPPLLSPLDFQAIFISWVDDADCVLADKYDITEVKEYLENVEQRLGYSLSNNQKWWYAAKSRELGFEMKQEYPTFPEEAFQRSTEGSIFGKEYERLLKEKRVQTFTIDKSYPTTVSYDIGVDDKTVLTYTQIHKGRPYVVRVDEGRGEGIEYYSELMHNSGFKIVKLFLPHDIKVREFSSGRTRLEMFRKLGWTCIVVKKLTVKDYTVALRQFLNVMIIHIDCKSMLDSIQMYSFKFDKQNQVYLSMPLHDIFSNYIDSLKYTATAIHYNKTLLYSDDDNIEDYELDLFDKTEKKLKYYENRSFAV